MVRLAVLALGLCLWLPGLRTCYAGTEDEAVRSISASLRARTYPQALEMARAALRDWPADVRLIVLEGMALEGLQHDNQALASFNRALQIAPKYVPALEAAAEIEYKEGNTAAIQHLEQLLVLRPQEEKAHAMLAVLARKRGDCAKAVEHFAQSRSAIAAQPDAEYSFGACLVKLKRAQEAAAVFQALLAAHPDYRRGRYALALTLSDLNRIPDAIETLRPLVEAREPDVTAMALTSAALESTGETP